MASTKDISTKFNFQSYNYTIVKVRLTLKSKDKDIYLNLGYSASLINYI